MEFIDVLRKKNMKVREFQSWGVCFRKYWEDNFANHVSDEEKKCLEGEEAENAFHNEVKRIATYSINIVMRYC